MRTEEITQQLQSIRNSEDFARRSAALAEAWVEASCGPEIIEPILRFMENDPSVDYGMPGPLVHFVERFFGKGYQEKLLESLRMKPTATTAWMLNRVINGTKAPASSRTARSDSCG